MGPYYYPMGKASVVIQTVGGQQIVALDMAGIECPCGCTRARSRPLPHKLTTALCTPTLLADLRGTAERILRLGWVAGTWFSPLGRCIEGALIETITGVLAPNLQRVGDHAPTMARIKAAREALTSWLGLPPATWNDSVAVSKEQVLAELDALAFEVERHLALRTVPIHPVDATRPELVAV